jgi:hypothetical protein
MLNVALAKIYSFASNRQKLAQPEDSLDKSQARSSVHFQKPTPLRREIIIQNIILANNS